MKTVRKVRFEEKEKKADGIDVALESSAGLGDVWVKLGGLTSAGWTVYTYLKDPKTGQRYRLLLGTAVEVEEE